MYKTILAMDELFRLKIEDILNFQDDKNMKGQHTRKGTACDCSTTITTEKAATLKANGYKTIGRYLTGMFKMTYTEVKTILNTGLNIFPIYETGGNKLAYFSQSQGSTDAHKATSAAKGYSCSSFVCDMSTGFSGKLGYPLPNDFQVIYQEPLKLHNLFSKVKQ